MEPQFTPVADHALLVTFGDAISDDIHASIVALDKAITDSQPNGFIEAIPAMISLLVSFNPIETDHVQLEYEIRDLLAILNQVDSTGTSRTIQVCYDEPFGPDLLSVANACNLDKEDVIDAHLHGDYKVHMYGFAPGYAYLGGVPENIQVPRKPRAIRNIPAGSVLIAGPQCLVTTLTMPTGWWIIGRSPTQILLDQPSRPFLFDVGDEVRFERIDTGTYKELSANQNNE